MVDPGHIEHDFLYRITRIIEENMANEQFGVSELATETGMIYRLEKDNPKCKFYPASMNMVCSCMKLITLEDIYNSLTEMKYIIKVSGEIQKKAKKAIDRMFEVLNAR